MPSPPARMTAFIAMESVGEYYRRRKKINKKAECECTSDFGLSCGIWHSALGVLLFASPGTHDVHAPTNLVALCPCNGVKHLPEQLQSLLSQTRQPDELIVFDDASGDSSAEIVRRFAESAPFPVRLSVNPPLGATENFQQAIAACGGNVIALCDQDDLWMSRKFHSSRRNSCARKAFGFVFTDAEICGETGGPLGYTLLAIRALHSPSPPAGEWRPRICSIYRLFRRHYLILREI